MLILIAYAFILFVFVEMRSSMFIYCSLVGLLFLGASWIQEILKKENIEYQVNNRRYNTIQEANEKSINAIKLTLRIGFAFAVLSIIGLLLHK